MKFSFTILMAFMIAKTTQKPYRHLQRSSGQRKSKDMPGGVSSVRCRPVTSVGLAPIHRLPVVALASSSSVVRSEVDRIAALGGIDVEHVADVGTGESAVLNLEEVRASVVRVRARFHPAYAPYFARGSLELVLPDESEDLLELLLAAGTTRRGRILGIVGVHGGAGASTVAAWLARMWCDDNKVALIDADQCSAGIDRLLAFDEESGVRWADLRSDSGVLVPGRLWNSLPGAHGLAVLSADRRGAMPSGKVGEAAIAALSQVSDVCIVDMPGEALVEGTVCHRLFAWVDGVIFVVRGGCGPKRQLARALACVPSGLGVLVAALGMGSGEAVALAQDLGVDSVFPVRLLASLAGDVEHGVGVGERKRSATARDLASLARASWELQ